tara:strand:+ start:3282 stop:3455 length:174 start_codon:yes stop_codon:yes gene_type:complete
MRLSESGFLYTLLPFEGLNVIPNVLLLDVNDKGFSLVHTRQVGGVGLAGVGIGVRVG